MFGKSSGGYGALVHAMRYPKHWGAAAAHAPDCGFELVYRPEFPVACQVLAEHDGDVGRFLESFWTKRHPGRQDFSALLVIAMAASYDPNEEDPPDIVLPFDLDTCELDGDRWQRWLRHDPLAMAENYVDSLELLHCLYIDVGNRDEYNIQFGARRLSARLEKLGVRHHFKEFDGTHTRLDWRLDHSLPLLAEALTGNGQRQESHD